MAHVRLSSARAWLPALLVAFATAAAGAPVTATVSLESLAVEVSRSENRAVSFTNKASAFYYTQTHRNDHPEHAWFRGLNLAGRRVFNDYRLLVDGTLLDPATAEAVVRPDALVRRYPNGIVETLRLFDGIDVVEVMLEGPSPLLHRTEMRLSGDRLRDAGSAGDLHAYVASGGGSNTEDHVVVGRRGARFLIAVGPSPRAAKDLFERTAHDVKRLEAQRRARLESLVNGDHRLTTDDPRLTEALRWIALTTDELVTRQRGDGIYAGLPWFNEYWGRDSFIALAGSLLVTGQFEQARAVLVSFAKFQDLDPKSRFYGRVPNIVKPDSLDYHTTDGTPRWVIALRDYVRYSGDRSVIAELYPNVKASIEGSLANWTDASGYLVHADNETWMDARRAADLVPYSPRGTRANDIQALWHDQLQAGAWFARASADPEAAARWNQAAGRVRARFATDYLDAGTGRIADRLDAQGQPDFTLRPNLFFALDLIGDPAVAARATRLAWNALAYPWGVATLDARDPRFHRYHYSPAEHHKDEAYHNGTVWPWLNGIAMQRLVADGQVEPAWQLFQNMNSLALTRGVVGGLPETMDAWPHPGEPLPRLTGTFLQAWSNAEQLRIWNEYFLGVRPDVTEGHILLAPRLPGSLGDVEFSARTGKGFLRAHYSRSNGLRRYEYALDNLTATLDLDLPPYRARSYPLASGERLVAEAGPEELRVRILAPDGAVRSSEASTPAPDLLARQRVLDVIYSGLAFATPASPH